MRRPDTGTKSRSQGAERAGRAIAPPAAARSAGARQSEDPPAESGTYDERLFLKSVAKTFRVLEAFGASSFPLTLSEIAKLADIDKSAAQRVCHTMQALGYLERDPSDAGLVPGKRLLERSYDYLRYNKLTGRAIPVLINLRNRASARVDLSLFDGTSIIYAHRVMSNAESYSPRLAGRRLPSYLASGGRAALAHLPDQEVDAILRASDIRPVSAKTTTDIDQIWAAIRAARIDGFAVTSEEMLQGELAIAAAILDSRGRPVGAVHVAGLTSDYTLEEFAKRYGPMVIEAARSLSER